MNTAFILLRTTAFLAGACAYVAGINWFFFVYLRHLSGG